MKKFKFKLEAFLKVKKFEEMQRMQDLAKVLGELETEKSQVRDYFSESKKLLEEESRKSREGNFNFYFHQATQRYLAALQIKKKVAEGKIVEILERVKVKQDIANKARKDRRVIEILKERREKKHNYENFKQENLMLDEFNQR